MTENPSLQISLSSLVPGKPTRATLGNEDLCVARIGDEVFAVADIYSHAEASLSEGELTDHKIECWLHGAEFDLRTGAALTPPASQAVKTYPVLVDGNNVVVEI